MEKIIDFEKCTGCHACFNACPIQCISMEEDKEGFLYPRIDAEKCIDCGKCKAVCPVLNTPEKNSVGTAYACINKNDEAREHSSSGGVFSLLANYVLDVGGVVFGAAFDDDLNVCHMEIAKKEELSKVRGSKYLQSNIKDTYKSAKTFLEDGKTVLFTGTPCQIGGLKAYLKKEYKNLYTQDLICYGVPSPSVWQKYLRVREKQVGASVRRISFRHKKYGWKGYSVQLRFADSSEYTQRHFKDLYMKAFLSGCCLRPSCYECSFKSVERQSDITLADFWGVDRVCPEFFDDKGTSLVVVNSLKGAEIFDVIKNDMKWKSVDIDEALRFNPAMHTSANKPQNRDRFMGMVEDYPFDYAVKKCIPTHRCRKVLSLAKRMIRKVLGR